MHRLAVLVGALVAALLLAVGTGREALAQAPVRMALVIGNSAYSTLAHFPLPNATQDAEAVAEQLHQLGFTDENIEVRYDVKRDELGPLLADFGSRLRAAGPDVVSFVYYSGHAGQDEAGLNYLIPVDSEADAPQALRAEATPLQLLFDDMAAAGNAVNVLVLDACRDWFEDAAVGTVAQRGLHDMGRHGNVFVGLATTPGLTVPDGVGAHSYYAARLIEALATRADQPLSLIFDDINELVHQDSEQAQFPEYINNLGVPRWCFKSGPLCGDTRTRPVASVYTSRFLKSLDRDRLLELTNDNEGFVDTLLARRDLLASNGIDSPLRLAHFLAAIGLETDFRKGFVEENLNFSAARLVTVFPRMFPDLDAAAPYAHDPEKIANLIYAGKLGNGDEASGDGWNFRGRGYFLFTGRYNYQLVLQSTGIDVLRAPDLLNNPEVSLAATAAYWSQRDLNASADADDFASVGKRISGRPYRRGPQMLEAAKRAVGLP